MALGGINLAVFLLWNTIGRSGDGRELMFEHFTSAWANILDLRLWTPLTAAFSQKDANHLLFNMFGLFMFGWPVERAIGSARLVALYVVAGIVGSLVQLGGDVVTGQPSVALGASGAINAIAVLYGCMYPRRTVLLFFFIPMPMFVAVGLFILMDVVGAVGPADGIGHLAHLGGAAIGFLAWLGIRRRLVRVER